jgi:hypothetical protein
MPAFFYPFLGLDELYQSSNLCIFELFNHLTFAI